jgi:hypothetical protein
MAGYNGRSRRITKKMVKTALAHLGRSKSRFTLKPFPVPVRLIGTAVVGLTLLAGIAYFIRNWSFVTGSADYQSEMPAASIDSAVSSGPEERAEPASTVSGSEETDLIPELLAEPKSELQSRNLAAKTRDGGRNLWLQVHSLQSRQRADLAVSYLAQKGFPTRRSTATDQDGALWFVVYVGPFENVETAEESARTLREQEQITPILRSFRN